MYSKKEKNEYFKNLRRQWKESKRLAENDEEAQAIFREAGLNGISYNGFYFVLLQLKALNLSGLPYVDCKTFKLWKSSGFTVKKGEKSKIKGITWLHPTWKNEDGETEEDDTVLFPKIYHLFHSSQVQEI